MKTMLLLSTLIVAACATDPQPSVERYSCILRFSCAGSDDVLARQLFTCADDVDQATEAAKPFGVQVAVDRCGADQWRFSWVTCDDDAVGTCDDD